MKECKDCLLEKPSTEFYKNKTQADRLHPYCKDCSRARTKAWRKANPEQAKKHNTGREAYFLQYRTKNKVRIAKLVSDWAKNNPEKRLINEHKRRARCAGESFSLEQWHNLCEYYEFRCLMCNEKFDRLSPDHVIPLSKGGSNTIDNIQPLCLSCNIKKGAKIVDYRKVSD